MDAPRFGPATDALYEWLTIFPHDPDLEPKKYGQRFIGIEAHVLRAGPVARAARARVNPYVSPPEPVQLGDAGRAQVRRRDDLGVVDGAAGWMTTTEAAHVARTLAEAGASTLQLVGAGAVP